MRTEEPSLGAIFSRPWAAQEAGSRRVASTSERLWILKTLLIWLSVHFSPWSYVVRGDLPSWVCAVFCETTVHGYTVCFKLENWLAEVGMGDKFHLLSRKAGVDLDGSRNIHCRARSCLQLLALRRWIPWHLFRLQQRHLLSRGLCIVLEYWTCISMFWLSTYRE